MGNQATPVIDAVQDFTLEKTILSGVPFVSSILGPGAYRITADSAPLFYTNPVLSGSLVPPSTLLCGEGSFNSSPRATLTYQWKRGGVNIPNETSSTWNSVLGDIGDSITCEVTATNASGSDTALSNVVIMEAILEGYTYQYDTYLINGLNAPGRQDVNELDVYLVAGMAHDEKVDVNQCEFHVVTGMQGFNNMTTAELEGYLIVIPEFLSNMPVANGNAENSVMTDWTMDSGNVQSVTTAPGFAADITTFRQGVRFFKADDLGAGVDSVMSQVLTIQAGDLTDVDTGRCAALASFIHQSEEGLDRIEVTMEALDAGSSVLNSKTTISPINPEGNFQVTSGWMRDTTVNELLILPTLTRFVKIIIRFNNISGTSNGAYADTFVVDILKA